MVFLSKFDTYQLLVGQRVDTGDLVWAEFFKGRFETEDPVFIEALMEAHKQAPAEVWPEDGAFICPECHKAFKTQFALDGHAKSHKAKAEPEAKPEAPEADEEE